MKKSELKQLIREEIQKVLEIEDPIQTAFNKAVGFTPSTGGKGNTYGLPLEKLAGYNQLANTRKEADLSSRNYISLPSLRGTGGNAQIYSKEEAQEWSNAFIEKYGVDGDKILFAKTNTGFDVINSPGYKGDKESTSKSISSFYDKLGYKGD